MLFEPYGHVLVNVGSTDSYYGCAWPRIHSSSVNDVVCMYECDSSWEQQKLLCSWCLLLQALRAVGGADM